ncbi:MalY/PatB family protein [uncultured Lactobacillus sp.]|uniref:MalY/PatB family protein n=1 Tax=uncultured Lactobacillus sp. TaxID=153152 RepID=UPI0026147EFF|nr:aminotransferase class I/II-fold pyridoxal phosphate-dependent enzyme [uncultured Lactobacillus sp.]
MIEGFDKIINRHNTYSTQWDYAIDRFGRNDVLPFSISDTDFAVPKEVQETLKKRIEHPIYGYTRWNHHDYKSAITNWYLKRFNQKFSEDIVAYTPSVVFAISDFIKMHSSPGEAVATFIPMYDAFFNTIESNNRLLVPVKLGDAYSHYKIDWDGLERVLCQKNVKIFLLTNPHNPTGKVFSASELEHIVSFCEQYNVFLISDDIHQDIVYKPNKYTPVLKYAKKNVVLCSSGSKTFNTPGLIGAYILCPNKVDYEQYLIDLKQKNALSSVSIFGMLSQIAEYKCEKYVDHLLPYLDKNMDTVEKFFTEKDLGLKFIKPQGTYLAWIDSSALQLTEDELQHLLIDKGHVGIMKGSTYGDQNRLRMNIACPRSKVIEGLNRIEIALS